MAGNINILPNMRTVWNTPTHTDTPSMTMGVGDVHFHPIERRLIRLTVTKQF